MSMPKIVISATGDEFFQPDDSYNWFDEMPGKTYVRLLPNAEHAMIPPQALFQSDFPRNSASRIPLVIVQRMFIPKMKFL